jgi:hypothetical protein
MQDCMVGSVYDELRGGAMRSYDVANRGRNRGLLSDSHVTQLLCNPSSREPVRVVLLKLSIYFAVEVVNDGFSLLLVCLKS